MTKKRDKGPFLKARAVRASRAKVEAKGRHRAGNGCFQGVGKCTVRELAVVEMNKKSSATASGLTTPSVGVGDSQTKAK